MSTPPRIFCIPSTDSPWVAVLRRGPSPWYHVGRWNPVNGTWEGGAWFRGRLYPQRCDLSPDGQWLAYMAWQGTASWALGPSYVAVSRLPWLHALAAWGLGSTYHRGIRFDGPPGTLEIGGPDAGDVVPLLKRFGLRVNASDAFAVERRRGWSESPDAPPRDPGDIWDERRAVRMVKPRPVGGAVLEVGGSYAAFRDAPHLRESARYRLLGGDGRAEELADVQWADWDDRGRLLMATTAGSLQVRTGAPGSLEVVQEHDLSGLRPEPMPAPARAERW